MLFLFLTPVLQRSAYNTSSAITAAFDAPLMSKFKEMLAVSDKTLRTFQKEMKNHPSPYKVFLLPFLRVSYVEQACH